MTDTAQRPIADLIEELIQRPEGEPPPPELFEAIVARGKEAVQPLIGLISREPRDEHWENPAYFAANLLGELRAEEAVGPILSLYTYFDDEELLEFGMALAHIGPPAVEPALSVLLDADRTPYQRDTAAGAAIAAARTDPALRDPTLSVVRGQLTDLVERAEALNGDERVLVAYLVERLALLQDQESRPVIDRAFGRDLVDPVFVEWEDVEEAYSAPAEPWEPPRSWLEMYRERYANRDSEDFDFMESEDEEDEDADIGALAEDRLSGLMDELERIPYIASPHSKIGRNDPCWCGSGKKYKQCHLEADERAVRSDV